VPYDSLDEVIARINAGPRPLALYPFSHDRQRLDKLLANVMSGGVSVNDALFHVAQHDLPFGGVGESGMGHYHGRFGFEALSHQRAVLTQRLPTAVRLLHPPYGPRTEKVLKLLRLVAG